MQMAKMTEHGRNTATDITGTAGKPQVQKGGHTSGQSGASECEYNFGFSSWEHSQ